MTSLPASITTELLSAYLDGQVTAAERARVEDALRADEQVRASVASLEHTINLFKDAPALAVPRPFVLSEQAVLAAGGRVRGGEQPGFWQRLLGPLNKAMPLATAAVAALLLLTIAVPRFSNQQVSPLAASQESSAENAAAPMAPAEAQPMISEDEAADMAAVAGDEIAMESSAIEAPAAARVVEEESAADVVEEPRLFSQDSAAKKVTEETPSAEAPLAAPMVAPAAETAPADGAAEVAEAPQAETAAPMAMQLTAEAPPAQNTSGLSTLQIGLLVLLVVMLAATVLLRRRARGVLG